jgi:hypothetical protein
MGASDRLDREGGAEETKRPPARDTARTILSMPVVRYPAAVASVLVAVDCAVAFRDGRWISFAVTLPVLIFLVSLASGALSRLVDSGEVQEPETERAEPLPPLPPASEAAPGWALQAHKIERDKALYAVGAILRRRGERQGSSREIWETEIAEFEAYLTERFGQLGKAPPLDLHAKVLMADRDAASHGDYREGLAGQFAGMLEG